MSPDTSEWAPAACTLPTAERPLREEEFADLFAAALVGVERTSRVTAQLSIAPEALEWARELAARESSCCSFFTFEFQEIGASLVMSVTVPAAQIEVLDALVASAIRAASLDEPGS
jgi:hypothetical protein